MRKPLSSNKIVVLQVNALSRLEVAKFALHIFLVPQYKIIKVLRLTPRRLSVQGPTGFVPLELSCIKVERMQAGKKSIDAVQVSGSYP